MLFGATPFANSPFADPGGVSIFVTVNGQRLNFAIGNVVIEGKSVVLPTGQRVNLTTGNVVIKIGQTVLLTGEELALATNPVSVISWNPIPPGVNQIWVPIDPDA
tara:strand:+ start:471 stop:785 length:315 start_codon:yes stop_codon:yes gene_type:complete